MNDDFNYFVDSVLVEAADRQKEQTVKPFEVAELCRHIDRQVAPTWISMVADRLRKLKYGELLPDSENPESWWFEISAEGAARAALVRRERAPKSIPEQLTSDQTQKLLNVGAFGVSILSLVIAIIALFKAGS